MRLSQFLQFSLSVLWILSAIYIASAPNGDLGTFDGGLIGFTLLYVTLVVVLIRDATRPDGAVPLARVRGGCGRR